MSEGLEELMESQGLVSRDELDGIEKELEKYENMRNRSELEEEIERIEFEINSFQPGSFNDAKNSRLWALKWVLQEE